MASPGTPQLVTWNWKRVALKWFAGGAGFAFAVAAIVGILLWYSSRPKPPRPWSTTALVAKDPPGFSSSGDAKKISLSYAVENTTDTDYQIGSSYEIKVLFRRKDGSLSRPLPTVDLPSSVFIPAKQKGDLTFSLTLSGVPVRQPGEADKEYHERLRGYIEEHLASVSGFVVFDDINHYEINLPRWLSKQPTETP